MDEKWFKARNITRKKPFLEKAPVLVLVFADNKAPYYIQSTWIAIGYFLLALGEKGLTTVTYTPSKIRWFNEFFNIPQNYVLQVILPIGKPATDSYKKQPRKN
ncbi:MAG: nitroreductase family protein [Candidatus Njordarchaeia archaeon]